MNSKATNPDDRWANLEDYLKEMTSDIDIVTVIDEVQGTEWLLVADANPANLKPKFYQALVEKFGVYIDRQNGGLSAIGEEKFNDQPPVFKAAQQHRRLREQQNRSQRIQASEFQEASPDGPRLVPIEKLTAHPLNALIFDENEEDDEALIRDIELHGQLEPIVVTPRYVVISGHRRLRSLLALGRTTALIVILQVMPENEEEMLLAHNLKRHMSNVEKLRVFSRYLEIERKRATDRQHGGKELPENSPNGISKGEARDIAARNVGLSGRSAVRGLRVLREIERRRGEAIPAEIQAVTEALNKSILAGWNAAIRHGWIAEIPAKKKQAAATPVTDTVVTAISSASASLKHNPAAHRLFRSTLPTVRKTVGTAVNPDKIQVLRRYAQALLMLADQLEHPSQPPKQP